MTGNAFANLTVLADRCGTDEAGVDGDGHLYIEFYAANFESLRPHEFCLLELGLLRCANDAEEGNPEARAVDRIPSVDMWLNYFPNATCYGFDTADFSALEKPRFKFIRGDLSLDSDIERLAMSIPSPRIIIDDASHDSFHQQRALLRLFPILEPGGFYAIEDLHDSPPFGASLPACRPLWNIVQEFIATGSLTLDVASREECNALAGQISHCFVHCSDRGRPGWGPKIVMFQKRPAAAAARSMEPVAPPTPVIDREWLMSKMFSFRDANAKQPYTAGMRFAPDGRIVGYRNRNESAWSFKDGKLTILREDGVPTCVASPVLKPDGTVSFVGPFLLSSAKVIHCFDESFVGDGLPMVYSFDLFDTLIARRCYDPVAVFHAVEEKSGITGFAVRRREEEFKLWQAGDYTLDNVYSVLGAATDWPEATLNRLRMLELAEEWENIFPIRDMTTTVRPGDLIISDMYLPLSFIKRVVEVKCGLSGCLIHLSSHGKHRGEIWQTIRSTHRIMRHFGDNHHSDVESARRAKLVSEHVTIARWSAGEKILVETGLTEFAKAVREVRLSSFDADPGRRAAQLAQLDVNIPLLIVAGIRVLRRAAEARIDTLLMCSRDCNLWYHLMAWMAPRSSAAPIVKYLTTSRMLFLSDSPEYRAYYFQMRGGRNMLLDVSGTGRSPSYFLGRINEQANTQIFLIAGTTQVANFVGELAPAREDVELEILSQQPHDRRLAIESLNMSCDGRAHQITFLGHEFETLLLPNEFGKISVSRVGAMREIFLATLANLSTIGIRRIPEDIPQGSLSAAADALIGMVGNHRRAYTPLLRDINHEETNIARTAFGERNNSSARLASASPGAN